jgi:hypothetical protein
MDASVEYKAREAGSNRMSPVKHFLIREESRDEEPWVDFNPYYVKSKKGKVKSKTPTIGYSLEFYLLNPSCHP